MKGLMLLIMAIWISGCATHSPLSEMQTNGQTTADLMLDQSYLSSRVKPERPAFDYDYSHYTRSAMSELDVLFPRLPNPTLVMFVYPHMSRAGVPVPGYSTAFPLFDSVEYALPGEAPYYQERHR